MPLDPESFLGVGPPPSGSPPASPASPESRDDRLARLSLKAFIIGLAVAVPGAGVMWAAYLILWMRIELLGSVLAFLAIGLFGVGFVSFIVSIIWGLRVVRNRRRVLLWVIPASLVVAPLAVAVAALAVSAILDSKSPAGSFGGVVLLVLVGKLVAWVARRVLRQGDKRSSPVGPSDFKPSDDNAKHDPVPTIKPGSTPTIDPPPSSSPLVSPARPELTKSSVAESFLGVDPSPSGSRPAAPVEPESREDRLARWSLKAFVLGLVLALTGGISAIVLMAPHGKAVGGSQTFEIGLFRTSLVILTVGLSSLIVSIAWGLRVMKNRRRVLWWVIPAGPLVAWLLPVTALLGGERFFWILPAGVVVVVWLVVFVASRLEARRLQTRKADINQKSRDDAPLPNRAGLISVPLLAPAEIGTTTPVATKSILGVDPSPSGSQPEAPVRSESSDDRLARWSLKAFVLGMVLALLGGLSVPMLGFLGLHVFSVVYPVVVSSWFVSISWGLRVVGNRRHVLWWVLPASLAVPGPRIDASGKLSGEAGLVWILAAIAVPLAWGLDFAFRRREARRHPARKPGSDRDSVETEKRLGKTSGAESLVGSAPESAGAPSDPLPDSEALETLRAESSLGAFVLGLLLPIADIVVSDHVIYGVSVDGAAVFYAGVLALAAVCWPVSVVLGLRVVKSRRYVLWWVIGAAVLFVLRVRFVVVKSLVSPPFIVAIFVAALLITSAPWMARWVHVRIFARVGRMISSLALAAWRRWQAKRHPAEKKFPQEIPVPPVGESVRSTGPKPSAAAAESAVAPDSRVSRPGRRWDRVSLAAFVLGLIGVLAGAGMILSFVLKFNSTPAPQRADPAAMRPFYVAVGIIGVGVASLIGSVVCGLYAVKSHRRVLWWVIPAALIVAGFVVYLAMNAGQFH